MLKNQKIIVFGGDGLIGRDITQAIVENNGTAIVASRTEKPALFTNLDGAARHQIQFLKTDVTDENSVMSLFSRAPEKFGQIDAIVNCSFPQTAGFGDKFEDVQFDNFCSNVNAHLGSAFLICQNACKYFESVGGGSIVNFSSIYGFMNPKFKIYEDTPMTKEVEYIVCKSAIIQLTGYLAKYYKGKGIRVNCVSPGGIADNQNQNFIDRYNENSLSKGMLDCVDIVGTVLFILSQGSRYINGQNLVVDDGFSL